MKKQAAWVLITLLLTVAIPLVTPYVFQFLMIPIVIKRQAFYPADGVVVFILWLWPALYITTWSHANRVMALFEIYEARRKERKS